MDQNIILPPGKEKEIYLVQTKPWTYRERNISVRNELLILKTLIQIQNKNFSAVKP